jgi:hypothetical protein
VRGDGVPSVSFTKERNMADNEKDESKTDATLTMDLWSSLTNMMCWVMFRSVLEMQDRAAAEKFVDKILLEWRSNLMKDVNVKINEVSSLRQAMPGALGDIFGPLLPNEEETRVKLAKSMNSVEKIARQMLLSKNED